VRGRTSGWEQERKDDFERPPPPTPSPARPRTASKAPIESPRRRACGSIGTDGKAGRGGEERSHMRGGWVPEVWVGREIHDTHNALLRVDGLIGAQLCKQIIERREPSARAVFSEPRKLQRAEGFPRKLLKERQGCGIHMVAVRVCKDDRRQRRQRELRGPALTH